MVTATDFTEIFVTSSPKTKAKAIVRGKVSIFSVLRAPESARTKFGLWQARRSRGQPHVNAKDPPGLSPIAIAGTLERVDTLRRFLRIRRMQRPLARRTACYPVGT
jgi:hypothetical protein